MSKPIPIVELPEIQALIEAGKLTASEPELSERFAEHLEQHYPWSASGSALDWDRIPGAMRLRFDEASDAEAADFLMDTSLARHLRVGVWHRRHEPTLICKFYVASFRLSTLFSFGSGARFLFGVDGEPGNFRYAFDDFVEVDGMIWLSGRPR
jgi:hypothetical protein